MAGWDFPTSATFGYDTWKIRSDFRAVLDVMEVLADTDIDDEERALVALSVFYYSETSDGQIISYDPREMDEETNAAALRFMKWFIRGGHDDDERVKNPRVMDWDQDFGIIAPPVNRVLGYECRSCDYLHWWTFLGAYMEIGDCYFAQVVSIRSKRARGKKLDKSDQDFYNRHRADIDLRRTITDSDMDVINEWI